MIPAIWALSSLPASASDFQVGYERLSMTGQEAGTQLWYRLQSQDPVRGSISGRVDYLNRFGHDEGKVTAGYSRRFGGVHTWSAELGLAPGSEILPRLTASAEYGRPVGSATALSAGLKFSSYSTSRNAELFAGGEQYLPRGFALLARAGLSRESYDGTGESAFHPAGLIKMLYFLTDDDRAWIYHGRGVEGFSLGSERAPGSIATSTWGIGAAKTFKVPRSARTIGVEGNLDWQSREGAIPRMVAFTLAFNHRW